MMAVDWETAPPRLAVGWVGADLDISTEKYKLPIWHNASFQLANKYFSVHLAGLHRTEAFNNVCIEHIGNSIFYYILQDNLDRYWKNAKPIPHESVYSLISYASVGDVNRVITK